MRSHFLAAALILPPSLALGEISSIEQCNTAIAADPEAAREEAAVWQRSGGGVPARLCEAAALEALGAETTAAQLLTEIAEDRAQALNRMTRAILFEDAARLWLASGQPDIASAALDSADALAPATPYRLTLRARSQAAAEDWAAARETLDALLSQEPGNALGLALRAASLRHLGEPGAALRDAERARAIEPDMPEAMFEEAAALAETGSITAASQLWMQLITAYPDHSLSEIARRNIQSLTAGGGAPTPPRPEPLRPRPRPAALQRE